MSEFDFHGCLIDQALHKAEGILFKIRNMNKEEWYKFITGEGPMKRALIKWCEKHELEFNEKLGLITVYLE